jgi:hypothetical protein
LQDERFRIDSRDVIHETIDGEVIVVALTTGCYYSLEGAGADIWDGLLRGRSGDEIVSDLQDRYEVDADDAGAAVSSLVDKLVSERLVHRADVNGGDPAAPGSPSEPLGERVAFPLPVLHKFTDMQDFLLVDPVHEVADAGWPHPAAAG